MTYRYLYVTMPLSVEKNIDFERSGGMTREVLSKLADGIRRKVEDYRARHESTLANEYLKGLRDAGVITEQERRILFIYTTV